MKKQIIIAGFGGQGALTIGKNIAEAALEVGMEVTWTPSYGPEMRGGTANCHVILSEDPIGSPMISVPTELIAMNGPSLEKFVPIVRSGGLVFVNSSITKERVEREDVTTYYVPCEELAEQIGNKKVANMVMLGAYIGATGVLTEENVRNMIVHIFTGPKAKLQEKNFQAIAAGIACVKA